ncbi:hypothetical protein ACSBR2_039921 [Camellia fascicularis]
MDSKRGRWIPVVKQRGKQATGRKADSPVIFTVLVDNLPSSMDPKGLFHLFEKFGVVKDIFIPQKRRRNTNTRFGFVRYSCEVAAKVAVQKAHGVKLAEFKRNRGHGQIHFQRSKQTNPWGVIQSDPYPCTSKKTYEVAVKGIQDVGNDFVTVKAEEYGNGWLYDSVVVRLKVRYVNVYLKTELKGRGIDGFAVRKGGGRDMVLSFMSKEEMEAKMKAIKDKIKDWCEAIIQWRLELALAQERIA